MTSITWLDQRYQPIEPNAQGRLELSDLDLEIALVDNWVRFWHRGDFLMTSVELSHDRDEKIEVIREQSAQLEENSERLRKQEVQLQRQQAFLKNHVRTQARIMKRDDILTKVDAADGDQLLQWLAELETTADDGHSTSES